MPESIGSGAAFMDFDGDGYQDIFLVNSRDWTPEEIVAYKAGNNRKRAALVPKSTPHATPSARCIIIIVTARLQMSRAAAV